MNAPLAPHAGELRASVRLPGIDRLRGLAIALMALDHVRDYFDADTLRFAPTDLSQTYPALFFTRFITHYCAPTFTLLAGVSACLAAARFSGRRELAGFLASRGLWLILLDALAISPVWSPGSGRIELGTLWAIGFSMVVLSGLVFLETRAVLALGLAILAGHNLLDGVHAADLGDLGPFWRLLHERGPLPFGLNGRVHYPALPWVGVIAVGYGLGPLFDRPQAERAAIFRRIGLAAILLFILVRAWNGYGDPSPWATQASPLFTLMSFLNVTKYPPSLDYALVTLGPALLLLPALEHLPAGRVAGVLETFGRVPLFFYVLHLYAALAGAVALQLAQGFSFADMQSFVTSGAPPPQLGVGLAGAYLVWIAMLTALYPACAWFAGVKKRRRDWWLSYL